MTKAETVAKLKRAFAADEFFPGALGSPVSVASRWGLSLSKHYRAQAAQPRKLGPERVVELNVGDTVEIPHRGADSLRLRGRAKIVAQVRNAVIIKQRKSKSQAAARSHPMFVVVVLVRSSQGTGYRIAELTEKGEWEVSPSWTVIGHLRKSKGARDVDLPLLVQSD
jgi:hypothetical protein